jgi:hypothetical protein
MPDMARCRVTCDFGDRAYNARVSRRAACVAFRVFGALESACMAQHIVLHDRRLEGGIPARPGILIINTNEHVPIHDAFQKIRHATRERPAETLFLVAHGAPGGVAVGKEAIKAHNVQMWTAIRNRVKNIVVYACSSAKTAPGTEGTLRDGQYVMGALAIHTNAVVFAADQKQLYDTYRDLKRGVIHYVEWQGELRWFEPSGRPGDIVKRPSTQLCVALTMACGGLKPGL